MTETEVVKILMANYLHWSLSFDLYSFKKIEETVKAIGKYNGFNPEKVAKLLWTITNYPALGADNVLFVTIGREFSPVIYVIVKKELAESLMKDFKELAPDELSSEEDSPNYAKVRAWWD
jgi:hypothetical protein